MSLQRRTSDFPFLTGRSFGAASARFIFLLLNEKSMKKLLLRMNKEFFFLEKFRNKTKSSATSRILVGKEQQYLGSML
jgi:uncharacterized membrane protein